MNTVRSAQLQRQWTASALVLREDRRLLLIHHRKLGVWLYPGGHIDPWETPDEAVAREVEEETGLRVRTVGPRDLSLADPKALVSVLTTPYVVLCERIHSPDNPHDHIDLVYLCTPEAGVDAWAPLSGDTLQAGFFGRDEVTDLPMFPNFRSLVRRVFDDDQVWLSVRRSAA
jgi:8-oxo-dGTP pyrophosphatase MutT (NUDIX family)